MLRKCHKFVTAPLSASAQNKKFNDLVKEALGDDCSYEAVQNIQDKLYELREDEVKTPEITVQVPVERTDLVETKLVNGRKCLVIALDGSVEVNGIPVH